ncbi:UNVERIFIED_CONTAM: hypothetical protein Sradi_7300400 [Sesamum radiatum]|uniref:Retrotransposon gag domain-containing protein n=1 Tax=Sesamum radiatum TaxID=300843 RepID=A0AAW2I9D7_SESRA
MVELCQQVAKDTMPTKCGVTFSEHIMTEELPAHFRAPSDLPAYDGTIDLTEHIRKFEYATLLHRSFAEFSSFFPHQFASNKKYMKSSINPFGIKQEEKETLMAYVQRLNIATLEVSTTYEEVLVNVFTQGLRRGPLLESLAKKSTMDFLDVLARAEKYIYLEDAWLVKKNRHDKRKEGEPYLTCRLKGELRGLFNPLDPKK